MDKGHLVAHKITDKEKDAFEKANLTLGSMGERVLGFAQIELDPKKYPKDYEFDPNKINFPTKGFTFIGLMSLIDPPREAVPDAIHTCQVTE